MNHDSVPVDYDLDTPVINWFVLTCLVNSKQWISLGLEQHQLLLELYVIYNKLLYDDIQQ